MTKKLKVLFLAGDPVRVGSHIRLDEEAHAIVDAIQRNAGPDAFDFRSEWNVRTGDLLRVMREHRPDIVHFAGHGDSAGFFLRDARFKRRAVEKEALSGLLALVKPTPHVVILNFCHSRAMLDAFRGVVDYAVGMNWEILDHAAIAFSGAFYGALAAGDTVEDAFAQAIHQLHIDKLSDEGLPELVIRPGVDPSARPLSEGRRTVESPAPPTTAATQTVTGNGNTVIKDGNTVFILQR